MLARILPALLISLLTVAPAVAQDDPDRCYTPSDPRCSGDFCGNTFYNPTVTQNWMTTRQHADAQVMQQVAGVYYGGRNFSSDGTMFNEAQRSYEANGLWQYRDQTCPVNNLGYLQCSQNQGAGLWAGYRQADGTIFLMVHFSDAARSNACFSQTIQLDNRGFRDAVGGNWQRVQ